MSIPIRRALYGKLSGDTILAGLLGQPAPGYTNSIYQYEAPEGAGFPLIVFSKSSGVPTGAFHNPTALQTDVWLVKAIDRNTSADPAETIAARIQTLLNDASLSIAGGATLMYLRRQSDVEYPEVVDGVSYVHAGALYRLIFG